MNISEKGRERMLRKLEEEMKLRKYSPWTMRAYVSVVKGFLDSGKEPRESVLDFADKSRSTIGLDNYYYEKTTIID